MLRPTRAVSVIFASLIINSLVITMTSSASAAEAPKAYDVYVGTYTGKTSKGIYRMRLDARTGALSAPELAGETKNPSFLAIDTENRYLFAVGEVNEVNGIKQGGVTAFAIDRASGKLTLLNQKPSGGQGPCFVAVDQACRYVLVANYGSGAVETLPVSADGHLGDAVSVIQHVGKSVDPARQAGPHAHSINLDPANRFAFACDLGLDKILIYRFDAVAGTLVANDPPAATVAPGAGPRHFAFHPDGKHAFVINEMGMTITSFRYNAEKGALTEIQTIPTLPSGASAAGASTAEVQVHPSGKFVYGSNRGHNSIAGYSFDAATEKLTLIGHTPSGGKTPRNFRMDPTGTFLLAAHQDSNSIVVFRIDPTTGVLTQVGEPVAAPSPVCLKFIAR